MATTTKSVDASLWWDPFSTLLTELENASLTDGIPQSLAKKLNDNHAWFLDTVARFKSPNQKSREALDSAQFTVGSHKLTVQPELKASALELSSVVCLDEVQSYILVERTNEGNTLASANTVSVPLHLVMLQYYIERQCLLKCTRQILMNALYDGTGEKEVQAMRDQTQKLVGDGLENKLLSALQDLLSCTYPENMSVDFFTLWAEETLIEDNLVLDILFLAYYESVCTCNGKQWKKLCLLYEGILSGGCNFGKLALSTEAMHSIFHAKIQLLLILIETLDLEYVLQMVHDETAFSDVSFNNFTRATEYNCQPSHVNLVSSMSYSKKDSVAWCLKKDLPCPRKPQYYLLFINYGGTSTEWEGNKYEEDLVSEGLSYFSSYSFREMAYFLLFRRVM